MEFVKFCNVSKEARLGVPAGGFIVTTKSKSDFLSKQVNMGKDFIVLPVGKNSIEKPIEIHETRREPEVKKSGRRSDKTSSQCCS